MGQLAQNPEAISQMMQVSVPGMQTLLTVQEVDTC